MFKRPAPKTETKAPESSSEKGSTSSTAFPKLPFGRKSNEPTPEDLLKIKLEQTEHELAQAKALNEGLLEHLGNLQESLNDTRLSTRNTASRTIFDLLHAQQIDELARLIHVANTQPGSKQAIQSFSKITGIPIQPGEEAIAQMSTVLGLKHHSITVVLCQLASGEVLTIESIKQQFQDDHDFLITHLKSP